MTNVLIAGYYGFGNLGDELALSSLLRNLLPRDSDVVVVSGNPAATHELHGVRSVSWQRISDVAGAVYEADSVIIGGGVFHDYLGFDIDRILRWKTIRYESVISVGLLANYYAKRLLILGAGVGPLRSRVARRLTRQVFQTAEASIVRDEGSLRLLGELGVGSGRVKVGADLTFLDWESRRETGNGSAHAPDPLPREPFAISVALRDWSIGYARAEWLAEIAAGLKLAAQQGELLLKGAPMQVASGIPIDDAWVSRELACLLAPELMLNLPTEPSSPEQTLHMIREANAVLSMRYHAIALAAQHGVPVVALSADPKVSHLMADLGVQDLCMDLGSLSRNDVAEGLIRARSDAGALKPILEERCRALSDKCWNAVRAIGLGTAVPEFAVSESGTEPTLRSLGREASVTGQARQGTGSEQVASIEDLRKAVLGLAVARAGVAARASSSRDRWADVGDHGAVLDMDEQARLDALAELLGTNSTCKGVVVFAPTVDWGYMRQRPQQMARALAGLGYLVLYCTPNQRGDDVTGFVQAEKRLWLTDATPSVLQAIPFPILILGSPWHRLWIEGFDTALVVYDICDDIRVSGGALDDHLELLRRADVVAATSQALLASALTIRPGVIHIPNAADPKDIEQARKLVRARSGRLVPGRSPPWKTTVGYMGAMAEWVDYDLLGEVAVGHPDSLLLLVGADYDGSIWTSNLLKHHNVCWMGELDHCDALAEVLRFDLATIPFKVNEITKATSPVKLFEYMACGKPCVTTSLPECLGFEGVYVAASPAEFVRSIDMALSLRSVASIRKSLEESAGQATWRSRAEVLARRIEDCAKREMSARAATNDAGRDSIVSFSLAGSLAATRNARERIRAIEQELALARNAVIRTGEEAQDRQHAVELANGQLAALQADMSQVCKEKQVLETALESEQTRAADALGQLAALRATLGVRLLDRYWRVLRRLAPEGSRTRVLYRRWRMTVRTFAPGGAAALQLTTDGSSASRHQWLAGRRTELADDETWFQRLRNFIDSPRSEPERGTVFILAPTRYEGNEGQRSYHLARELSRRGRKVVFGYWRWHAEGVDVSGRTDGDVLAVPLDVLLSDPDRSLAADAGRPGWILLEFPFPGAHRFLATANARGYLTVYDAVDDWEAFHRVGQAPWFDRDFERALGAICDTVLAVSPRLQAIVASRCRQSVHLVPNAWAPDIMTNLPSADIERGEITVGYFGHLTDSWFDWDLLLECARRRPDWRFHLIGYGGGWRTTKLPQNVQYHGQLPRSVLAAHSAAWDVGIVPFRRGPVAAAADPIKIYEYLALDLPVAASGVVISPEARRLIRSGEDADGFLHAVENAVADRTGRRAERMAFASASTWGTRVDMIERVLGFDDPRVAFKSRVFDTLT